jgi:hypothetical protein
MKDINCICCGNPIKPLDIFKGQADSLKSHLWDDAMVTEIVAGYGSGFDCDKFIIGICDTCIEKKLKSGTLTFLRNLDYPEEENIIHPCCE